MDHTSVENVARKAMSCILCHLVNTVFPFWAWISSPGLVSMFEAQVGKPFRLHQPSIVSASIGHIFTSFTACFLTIAVTFIILTGLKPKAIEGNVWIISIFSKSLSEFPKISLYCFHCTQRHANPVVDYLKLFKWLIDCKSLEHRTLLFCDWSTPY